MSNCIMLSNKNGKSVNINPSKIKKMELYYEDTLPPFNVPRTKITMKDDSIEIVKENIYEINKLITS